MRRSIDTLSVMVVDVLKADPLSGQAFVFLSRGRNRMKVLLWDRNGFVLVYKRLERGVFPSPGEMAREGLSMAQLGAWLEGVDLSRAPRLAAVAATRVA
jgi:transposase